MILNDDLKLQIYAGTSWDEYKKALDIAKADERVIDIKEVGEMETTDFGGDRMFAYVFVMTAPNGFMSELCEKMGVQSRPF